MGHESKIGCFWPSLAECAVSRWEASPGVGSPSQVAKSAWARHAASAEICSPHAIPAAVLAENVEGSPHAMSAAISAENVGNWVRRPADFVETTHAISDAISAKICGESNSLPLFLPILTF